MRPHFRHRTGFVKHPILRDIKMIADSPEPACQMACQQLLLREGNIGSCRAAMHHKVLDTAGKILSRRQFPLIILLICHHFSNRIKVAHKRSRPTPKR